MWSKKAYLLDQNVDLKVRRRQTRSYRLITLPAYSVQKQSQHTSLFPTSYPASAMATTSESPPDRVCPHVADVGFTELYRPESTTEILADLVFVHGLAGHPRRTWLYGEGSKHESLPAPGSSVGSRRFSRLFGKKSRIPSATEPPLEVDPDTGQCFWPYDLLAKEASMKSTRVLTYGYDSHPTHFYRSATNRMTISQHAGIL